MRQPHSRGKADKNMHEYSSLIFFPIQKHDIVYTSKFNSEIFCDLICLALMVSQKKFRIQGKPVNITEMKYRQK